MGDGTSYPEHVGLRDADGYYYDARGGPMDERTFLSSHREGFEFPAATIRVIPRETVELHAGVAGVPPPYKGNKDIAEARRAVRKLFDL